MNDPFQSSPRGFQILALPMAEKTRIASEGRGSRRHSEQQTSFDQFLEAVRRQMQPEGRAQHTAGMHQHLRTLFPSDVTLADLVAGWQVLAQSRHDTNSEVLHRRKTCAEMAIIAAQFTSEQGKLTGAVKTWQAWLTASQRSTDPRLTAMRATFARELMELQSER